MVRVIPLAVGAFLVGVAAALCAPEHGPADTARAKESRAKTHVPAGELVGVVARVNAAERLVKLRVQVPVLRGRRLQPQLEEVELEAADDVKVRLSSPPPKYDDKGNPRRYTQAELRRMRDSLGYLADFDALKSGQTVHVSLVKPRPGARAKGAPEPKPVIGTILILAEASR